ncbi:hypothetical protein PP460_gp013 [Streptomyces phage Muntaha]|uniref:Uncharacterized protein n=1 Tax=Streptomyces phage Muntaha TaxID=2713269 RepID=A0A6G8R3L4_9CAUD|nr:hypothetical protein PP460_gp003 [Streptomyces phage Muntaha]YP_010652545.1 hypothetical protein PP460_gp013 [Streptomyces phage Muntaha]QIN94563.1 hypothetical protein SEA_MUNTAHA_3 [Streptomyces phage Muntaha]QIN94789.1 hypothetical protein SEA_MUNTAHA_266 [Streptomyces phage Muntaha]
MVDHTNPAGISGMRITDTPTYGRTVSGYGGKIPTRYMVRYLGVWRRVYMMQYGNAGSAYVIVKGRNVFLDTDTEYGLMGLGE